MKALFTTFPAYGHLLPMLPLAAAAAAASDEAIVVASDELHGVVDGLQVRTLRPSLADLLAENDRRFGQDALGYRTDSDRLLDTTVALFTTTRADLAFDELCDVVADEHPDVLVAEMWDYLAPLVASRLDIPWVSFVHSPATPVDAALDKGMATALDQRTLAMPARLATVQLWPEWLDQNTSGENAALPIGSSPYDTSTRADLPAFDGARPVVLVTLGTVVEDLDLLNTAVRSVLEAGADALVTSGFTVKPEQVEGEAGRVHVVPFAPIGQLLDRSQAVVAAGGSGTTLATLSQGLPLAFVPRVANQPLVASLVSDFGAGTVCEDPATLTAAVSAMLHEPNLRARAQAASELLDRRPTPETVWAALQRRTGVPVR